MARMTAAQAAVWVMEKEGVTQAFGVPGRRDQPALLRPCASRARIAPHPGAPRRGRLAHGRGLHPRRGRQHRRVHRHLRSGRHRHDHRACIRRRPTPSRSSASPARRRAPGCTRRTSRRWTSSPSPSRSPNGRSRCANRRRCRGTFQQAFHLMRSGRPGPGADRPALRRADGRDRVRSRHLRAAAGLQAGRDARADRKGAGRC